MPVTPLVTGAPKAGGEPMIVLSMRAGRVSVVAGYGHLETKDAPARWKADGGVGAMPDGWGYPVTSERFHELSTGPTSW